MDSTSYAASSTGSSSPNYSNHHKSTSGSRRSKRLPLNLYQHDCHRRTLVGRARECTALHAAWDRVRNATTDDYNTVATPSSEVVWVEGAAGTGKSTLIEHALESLVRQSSGIWAWGKFSQPQSHAGDDDHHMICPRRPYGAMVEALESLCAEIIDVRNSTGGDDSSSAILKQEEIQKRVEAALGSERRVLSKLVPAVDILCPGVGGSGGVPTKKQQQCDPPKEAPLAVQDGDDDGDDQRTNSTMTEFAFQRFVHLVCAFLRAVASAEHPVCLVLDDCQWCDEASRRLVEAVASDTKSHYVLLVAATRPLDNLPNERRPATSGGAFLQTKHGLALTKIDIGNLTLPCVNEIVSQATEMRPEKTRDLSAVLLQKTHGNALFVLRYLEMLYSTGLLDFSFDTAQWTWNLEEIKQQTNVSDNVGDLLKTRIEGMPHTTKQVLMVASCLHSHFDIPMLETVMESIQEILLTGDTGGNGDDESGLSRRDQEESSVWSKAVQTAREAGLLEQVSSVRYKFPHDCIQEAALALVPTGENGIRFHFRLGEIVLELSRSEDAQDWTLFTAVDLLTKYSSDVDSGIYCDSQHDKNNSKSKKQEFALACLAAAQRASERSAFPLAVKYAESGLDLLSIRAWIESYQLCLDLHITSCESQYAYANFDKSEKTALHIISNGSCLQDKLKAYHVRISILASRGDLGGAVSVSLDAINQLGVSIPPDPTGRQVNRAFTKATKLMAGRKPSDLLVDLPPIPKTSVIIDQLRFLHRNTIFSWHAGRANLCILQCLTMMHITLNQGYCQFTPHGVAVYGGMISNSGRLEEAFEFGTLAKELLKRPGMREEAPVSIKVIHLFLNHLQKPLYDSLEPLLQGYRIGMEKGDIQIASRILSLHGVLSVVAGMPVANLSSQIESYCGLFREYKQYDCLLEVLPLLQLARQLMGTSESPLLSQRSNGPPGDIAAEQVVVFEEDPSLRENLVIQLHTVVSDMLLYCVFGDFPSAVAECAKVNPFENITYSYFMKPFLLFLSGFSFVCLARQSSKLNRMLFKRQGSVKMRELKKFVKCGSVNAVPWLVLLEAEFLAFAGPTDTVVTKYESAISMSGRSGFRLVKSIACERCGNFLLQSKEKRYKGLAQDYLRRACEGYSEYGAHAKVSHMELEYTKQIDFSVSPLSPAPSRSSVSMQPHLAKEWRKQL